ncbi:MAG: hypothetical protein PHX87_02955 [Candidatus Peribacteraceae bacterium]|nr:hypothetical protein [Candidatus Peribacteraceae bacterium]MDD5742368.1 hypothetical protein [Candidatus Peribacteraceae bacterium]
MRTFHLHCYASFVCRRNETVEEKHNVAHASVSQQAAYDEIRRFFPKSQMSREAPELAALLYGDDTE